MDLAVAARGIGTIWQPQIDAAVSAAPDVLTPALIKAVIATESAWNEAAVDPTGTSYGLMQINARAWGVDPVAALNPEWNISRGADILAGQLRRRGGDLELALAAYNAGTERDDGDLLLRLAQNTRGVASYVATVQDYAAWYVVNDVAVTGIWELIGGAGGDATPAADGESGGDSFAPSPTVLIPATTEAPGYGALLVLGLLLLGVWALGRA